ncbi:DUF881 domain-containing protein [Cryptosporangium aurantiacum]|uniref:Uncharacterized conserved protein YlxW, UPF0749 family n=1 Tax=Cryptosporangium aurantiacum TaxID=134849 RepID=A0A1M7RN15_9ACTN|nr:DUF881 domain-containing protein [Cryptosporangium aurantiacum]SHN47462.1 Uncharacterized conserved protein YlxW, UPF0749 family [Cryptosporangium aurantiacum]
MSSPAPPTDPGNDAPETGFRLFGKGAPPSPGLTMLADLMNNHLDPGYAEAARRRENGEPPSRLASRSRGGLTLLCAALIGVVLAVAYREAVATAPEAAETREALTAEVRRAQTRTDELQQLADRRREEVAAAQDAAVADSSTGRALSRRVRDAEAMTGVAPVTGPGIVLEVSDGEPTRDPVTGATVGDAEAFLVQDGDLQSLANAVWAAGAEAVAIDGQRLTALSTIRSAGSAVLVDFRPVDNPYTITAVGDADALYRALLRAPAVRRFQAYVKDYKMGLDLRRDDELRLPAGPDPELREAARPRAESSASPSTSTGPAASTPPPTPTPSGGTPPTSSPTSTRPAAAPRVSPSSSAGGAD